MSATDLILALQNHDKTAQKEVFDTHYGLLAAIANRYAKNPSQAEEMLNPCFHNCLVKLQHSRPNQINELSPFFQKEFILECVAYIKNIRSEYYVSSTVYASSDSPSKNYNLFENHEAIDYRNIDNEVLIKALQQLVPSQRLVFNLHVIDGFSLEEAAALLESSEATVKSNLEKSRYNLQKNIEKSLKTVKA
jgi:RNA polymerase sigma-70 factor, ECF subfamily